MRNVGRTRKRLAAVLSSHFGVTIDGGYIHQMNSPDQRELDLPRWGVYVDLPGRPSVWVHSWDTMGDVLRFGLAVVKDEETMIQVCADER